MLTFSNVNSYVKGNKIRKDLIKGLIQTFPPNPTTPSVSKFLLQSKIKTLTFHYLPNYIIWK